MATGKRVSNAVSNVYGSAKSLIFKSKETKTSDRNPTSMASSIEATVSKHSSKDKQNHNGHAQTDEGHMKDIARNQTAEPVDKDSGGPALKQTKQMSDPKTTSVDGPRPVPLSDKLVNQSVTSVPSVAISTERPTKESSQKPRKLKALSEEPEKPVESDREEAGTGTFGKSVVQYLRNVFESRTRSKSPSAPATSASSGSILFYLLSLGPWVKDLSTRKLF